jgi:hypothetical protein
MRTRDINGAILGSRGSTIQVSKITLELSYTDAYALCNLLTRNELENSHNLEKDQKESLMHIGRDLGILVDHTARHNLGKFKINYLVDAETKGNFEYSPTITVRETD